MSFFYFKRSGLLGGLLCVGTLLCQAQTIPAERTTYWSSAGLSRTFNPPSIQINLADFGLVGTGNVPCDSLLTAALKILDGKDGEILFPSGNFLFNRPLRIPSGTILKGGPDSKLIFDLNGNGDCIQIYGQKDSINSLLRLDAKRASTYVIPANFSGFNSGDLIRISLNDVDLVTSDWARGSVGQLVRIDHISFDTLFLEEPLRMDFPVNRLASIERLIPIENCRLECLQFLRMDSTSNQTSMVDFKYASNCVVRNCVFSKSNFAHIAISYSSNVLVESSLFEDAFDFGPGGRGYGITLQYSSGMCLVQNNVFRKLRHSVLLQAGCNGNVVAYNHSQEPLRTEFPSDASGDIVLHGNYPFLNLIEGNSVQQIYIDNSHGLNGPYNTLFRNRTSGYGIVMSFPYSPSQNIVGNEIIHPQTGFYLTGGTDLLEFQNNKNGVITPSGSMVLKDTSYFFNDPPIYLRNWWYPTFGPPLTSNSRQNPAQVRWEKKEPVVCTPAGVGIRPIAAAIPKIIISPNPNPGRFEVQSEDIITSITLRSEKGKILFHELGNLSHRMEIRAEELSSGIYFIEVQTSTKIVPLKWVKY